MGSSVRASRIMALSGRAATATLFLSLIGGPALAKDFGVQGTVFPIAEENFLDMIRRKLEAARDDGRLDALQETMRTTTVDRVEAPRPVDGIVPARQYRARYFDPTFVSDRDYHDADGRVVVSAGSSANPFDTVSLPYALLFIDGTREVEVEWAMSLQETTAGAVKIVLLDGRPLDVMREHQVRVYFDQNAALSNHFELSRTPVRVSQEGRALKIEEIPLQDAGGAP